MNIVVNGLMTNYQKVGNGRKTIVLLHGWGEGLSSFNGLTKQLENDYTVLALDLPGIGATQAPDNAWDLNDYCEFIKAWLQKVGISEVHVLIGHSNGGAISIYAVANNIIEPQKLVLLASSGVRNRNKLRRNLLKVSFKAGKVITSPLPHRTRAGIRSKLYKKIGSDVGIFPQMEETFRKITRQDVQNDSKNIKIPTLLLYGDKDKTTPATYGQLFQKQISSARLEIIHDAGHFLHQEQPELIAGKIINFLNSNE